MYEDKDSSRSWIDPTAPYNDLDQPFIPNNGGDDSDSQTSSRLGEVQPKKCNDWFFAFLFYGQVAAIVVCAFVYGEYALQEYSLGGISTNAMPYMSIAAITGAFAFILSGTMLFVMTYIASFLIKFALLFQLVLSGVWTAYAIAIGNIVLAILGVILFLLGCCYAWMTWSRIPFATANLVTGLTAVKKNCGVSIVAYLFAILSVAWFYLWSFVAIGIVVMETCDEFTRVCDGQLNGAYLFLLFLSFFFTLQVIQNSVHVTVAGVVGTWWFSPEDSGCCSTAVLGSTFRTLTSSFGSICFGSLLVAILQALRQLVNNARTQDDGIFLCIAECLLSCLESMLEYFNKWAFVYVGLYGYNYIEAGKNVMTLFKNRGWEVIIADDLVNNVLFLVSLVVGGISGLLGMLLEVHTDLFPAVQGADSQIAAFVFGFIIGVALCSILMSVVASSVNTVIVCFAEGPAEFQTNHRELSDMMRETWLSAFPGCI
eukprot:CAMPEP_0195518252 /NCGR_PEP_ID=MMETSP0794_2-20130614/12641_1 /TAXON_ID=515487 /ORGANISM="Stephanopyxis turris, Strain CCMP 815" /LENGTH=483 /DNA_ID=CAMNT_0040647191 /DNA_START=110 /DNA_END=1561 /DNA_ORIENTATION=+